MLENIKKFATLKMMPNETFLRVFQPLWWTWVKIASGGKLDFERRSFRMFSRVSLYFFPSISKTKLKIWNEASEMQWNAKYFILIVAPEKFRMNDEQKENFLLQSTSITSFGQEFKKKCKNVTKRKKFVKVCLHSIWRFFWQNVKKILILRGLRFSLKLVGNPVDSLLGKNSNFFSCFTKRTNEPSQEKSLFTGPVFLAWYVYGTTKPFCFIEGKRRPFG